MLPSIAIVYNQPANDRYQAMGEAAAIEGVMDEVKAVEQALVERRYPVHKLGLEPPVEAARRKLEELKSEVVFNLFEGFAGRPETEAMIAAILEKRGIRHTGCPANCLTLALDKVRTKRRLEAAGILTARYQSLSFQTFSRFNLAFPCIVKPAAEDASHGITAESLVYDLPGLQKQLERVSRLFGGQALVEEFLEGREFNTTLMGNQEADVLAISEIVYTLPPGTPRILTFAAKWEEDSLYYKGTQPVCPAEIESAKYSQIAEIARQAYRLVGCRGYARVDLREDSQGQPRVLEVNPNPDIGPTSGAARQALVAGLSYSQFVERIIGLALE